MRRAELSGQRFGRLVVEAWVPGAGRDGAWLCRCDCGGAHLASSNHLNSGRVLSCGCLRPRHGGKGTRAYGVWLSMKRRCTEPTDISWPYYGARGITVCERWKSFPEFLADMGTPPAGLTIERIDNNGNYEPGNCRWATRKEQARNTRRSIMVTFEGRTQSLPAWAEELGISYWKLHTRYKKLGWTPERMFSDVM